MEPPCYDLGMELVNTWILFNALVPFPHPNTVVFDRCGFTNSDLPNDTVRIVQFASAGKYCGEVEAQPRNPVCVVVSTDLETVRKLWDRFVHEGWSRVDAATPHGCGLAICAIRARAHRESVKNVRVGAYTGDYSNEITQSDPVSSLYFRLSAQQICGTHPVTHMPQRVRQVNSTANTRYALEA